MTAMTFCRKTAEKRLKNDAILQGRKRWGFVAAEQRPFLYEDRAHQVFVLQMMNFALKVMNFVLSELCIKSDELCIT